jgi:hypothetical protein
MNDLVESCKASAVDGMEYFLRNFSHVPDDKLHWTPTPTAKSALRIAAHTALYAGRFARMIEDPRICAVADPEDWMARCSEEEAAITDRAEMERVFRQGTEEVLAALDALSPETIGSRVDSGQGWSMSMQWLMNLPGWHATLHAGQIDFLQTCWGDQEIYV